jgi:hypothetical protein
MSDPEEDSSDRDETPNLTVWQIVSSTVAAAFGVQSSRNRERDFAMGKPSHFIVAGIVFTALFVLGMILLVNLVLRSAA